MSFHAVPASFGDNYVKPQGVEDKWERNVNQGPTQQKGKHRSWACTTEPVWGKAPVVSNMSNPYVRIHGALFKWNWSISKSAASGGTSQFWLPGLGRLEKGTSHDCRTTMWSWPVTGPSAVSTAVTGSSKKYWVAPRTHENKQPAFIEVERQRGHRIWCLRRPGRDTRLRESATKPAFQLHRGAQLEISMQSARCLKFQQGHNLTPAPRVSNMKVWPLYNAQQTTPQHMLLTDLFPGTQGLHMNVSKPMTDSSGGYLKTNPKLNCLSHESPHSQLLKSM